MAELKERVGGGWKPSPGAIYPALIALVETGHVQTVDRDGTRIYSLTKADYRQPMPSELRPPVGLADSTRGAG